MEEMLVFGHIHAGDLYEFDVFSNHFKTHQSSAMCKVEWKASGKINRINSNIRGEHKTKKCLLVLV